MDTNQVPDPSSERSVCRATTRLLALFVAGQHSPEDDGRLRRHTQACPACRTAYQETMNAVANLGRRVRLEREESNRRRRHDTLRERAFAATADPRSKRRFGLRLALLPAGIALIMIMWQSSGGGRGLRVHWESSEAFAAGTELNAEQPELALSTGDWCETGEKGRIRLATFPGEEVQFSLGPETQLQVEDVRQGHVRLRWGVLQTKGPCQVVTSRGVLDAEQGSSLLRVVGAGFELECLEGELAWIGPGGEWRLSAGESHVSSSMLAGVR